MGWLVSTKKWRKENDERLTKPAICHNDLSALNRFRHFSVQVWKEYFGATICTSSPVGTSSHVEAQEVSKNSSSSFSIPTFCQESSPSSTALPIRFGFVTSKSSPTICTYRQGDFSALLGCLVGLGGVTSSRAFSPTAAVNGLYPSQSSWSKGSSMETIGYLTSGNGQKTMSLNWLGIRHTYTEKNTDSAATYLKSVRTFTRFSWFQSESARILSHMNIWISSKTLLCPSFEIVCKLAGVHQLLPGYQPIQSLNLP